MKEPGFLSHAKIAIIGLGLMGGSLALALRGKCAALFGADPDSETIARVRERKILDRVSESNQEIIAAADVIILAAPVRAIIDLLDALPSLHPAEAIVLDVGSTKTDIVAAMSALPARFDPLGGHPMCGKEKSSILHADAHIFAQAPFAFTPLPRTTPRARAFAIELAEAIGARPLWIDPETHDRWTAATSHFPYLLANALALATPIEAAPMIGPGFRSTTRIAAASTKMMCDILSTNRENVLHALDNFLRVLEGFQTLLQRGEDEKLGPMLAAGVTKLDQMYNQCPGGDR